MWGALDCSAVLRSLATEGIAILPERPPDQVKEMNRFLSDNPVVLPSGERVHHERVPRGCTIACTAPGFLDTRGGYGHSAPTVDCRS